MYVKVYQKGNQWFREDNKTLVGFAITSINEIYYFERLYGSNKLFAISKGNIVIIYNGYYDKNGTFTHFCKKNTGCRKCHPVIKDSFCYKRSQKFKSAGYYIKVIP